MKEEELKQKIENYHLDIDKLTGIYQEGARLKSSSEVSTVGQWKKYLENNSAHWHEEGDKWAHKFYHEMGDVADKHLNTIIELIK